MLFEDILSGLRDGSRQFNVGDITALSPLTLAYIGDAVYEVYIRTLMITSEPNKSVHKLHLMSTSYVRAHAQSEIVHRISPCLTEEELNIIRRGRNSKSASSPKNADILEYRTATGFEALVGYLYLSGRIERLTEILKLAASDEPDSM